MDELSRYRAAKAVVDEQARDSRLWHQAERITEATLQQELRRLHAAIEGVQPDDLARDFLARVNTQS